MSEHQKFTLLCPCCQATLTIDAKTGTLISHEAKAKPVASFEAMQEEMERQKQTREQLFSQELGSQKERERLLDEKFREALRRAQDTPDDAPFRNPLDLD